MKAILTAATLSLLLTGCDSEPEAYLRDCLEKEKYMIMVMLPNGSGGLSSHWIPQTRCVLWSDPYPNPRHAEWVERQRTGK